MHSIAKLSEFAGHLRRLIRATPNVEKVWTDKFFGDLASTLFEIQRELNEPYRTLCFADSKESDRKPQDWKAIPAVPTSAFKDFELSCVPANQRTAVFHSSGTTQHRPSRHFHNAESLAVYEESLLAWFPSQLQISQRFPVISLTPLPELAPHSSLVHMFEALRSKFGSNRSEFLGRIGEDGGWTLNFETALEALRRSVAIQQPILILGTAFLYVHLLDYLTELDIRFKLPAGSRVMETGGYKGRSRSIPKDELHQLICGRLGILPSDILCEYGMSELSSQAYNRTAMHNYHPFQSANPKGIPPQSPVLPSLRGYPGVEASEPCNPERVAPNASCSPVHEDVYSPSSRTDPSLLASAATRVFHFPPWARVQILSPETGREVSEGETGLIRVFDLANVFSVIALQTEDLGIRCGDGFELVGRASFTEARGCSLMAV